MSDLSDVQTGTLLERTVDLARGEDPQEDDRYWEAVRELHRRGEAVIFDAATRWCASPERTLRQLGADVLAQLGFGDGHPFAAASTAMLMALLSDTEPEVIDSALVALGHLRTGDDGRISALASHESEDVRHGVAYCLGGRPGDLARLTLIHLSADAGASVRDWATFALARLTEDDDPSLRDALAARLDDPDMETRGEAIRGLAARNDVRVVTAVVDALADPDDVSYFVFDAVTEMSDDLAAKVLAKADRHPDGTRIRGDIEYYRRRSTSN